MGGASSGPPPPPPAASVPPRGGRLEPWYASFATLGVSTDAMASILLPLAAAKAGGASSAGMVMAAVSLGWLLAPLWGSLADRTRAHRLIYSGGALLAATMLLSFRLVEQVQVWLIFATALGAGVAAFNTVANLFVVEAHPRPEWNQREARLQTLYTIGLTLGLLLAAGVTHHPLSRGLPLAAAITLGGALLGAALTRTPPRPAAAGGNASPVAGPRTAAAGRASTLRLSAFGALRPALASPFGPFLAGWLLFNVGCGAAFALYPLIMQHEFAVSPRTAATVQSAFTAASLLLYGPCGRLSNRLGAAVVLRAALAVRLLCFASLVLLGALAGSGAGTAALAAFGIATLAYAAVNVAGPVLTSSLAPIDEGEAMGIFMATTSLGWLLGSAGGGWAAEIWGYAAVPALAAAAVALALLVGGLGARGRRTGG